MTADDYERAWAFMRLGDVSGPEERPVGFGTAVLNPELPLRHDSNFLFADAVEPGIDAAELVAETNRILGGAGLGHRAIVVPGEQVGERLAETLAADGWMVRRHVVMVHRHDTDTSRVDTSLVEEVDEAALRPARRRYILDQPWGTPEVAEQLLDARLFVARRLTLRCFAILVDGEVVSYTDLYSVGNAAQIEDVATAPEHRGRGYAKAVVMRALAEARVAGADFVFLVADDEDWPKEMYARLGFEPAGRYFKFARFPV